MFNKVLQQSQKAWCIIDVSWQYAIIFKYSLSIIFGCASAIASLPHTALPYGQTARNASVVLRPQPLALDLCSDGNTGIHTRRGFSVSRLLRSRTCRDLGGNAAPGGTHGAHPCHVWNGNTERLHGYAHVYLSLPPKCKQEKTQFASGRKIKHGKTMKIKWNIIFLCQVKNWSMDWHLDLCVAGLSSSALRAVVSAVA